MCIIREHPPPGREGRGREAPVYSAPLRPKHGGTQEYSEGSPRVAQPRTGKKGAGKEISGKIKERYVKGK